MPDAGHAPNIIDLFAKVGVVSGYLSRLHHFLHRPTSRVPRQAHGSHPATHFMGAPASSLWAAELAQSPHSTRSSHSDILALRLIGAPLLPA
jgi:hypothetical protein